MFKQFLGPGSLSAECVQVSVMQISDTGASRELSLMVENANFKKNSKKRTENDYLNTLSRNCSNSSTVL